MGEGIGAFGEVKIDMTKVWIVREIEGKKYKIAFDADGKEQPPELIQEEK